MNPIPIGAHFNKAYEDPSQPGTSAAGQLPSAGTTAGAGHQHCAPPATTPTTTPSRCRRNRRFAGGLQTGRLVHLLEDSRTSPTATPPRVSPYFSPRSRNYGRSGFDRPHVFVSNFYYDLPNLGNKMDSKPAGWFLDNWNLSGIWTRPAAVRPSLRDSAGPPPPKSPAPTEGARVNIVGQLRPVRRTSTSGSTRPWWRPRSSVNGATPT